MNLSQNVRHRLAQFFGGYFHQDWDLDASSSAEVVQSFIQENHHNQTVMELSSALSELLREVVSESDLRAYVLNDLGSYHDPLDEGGSVRSWLTAIQSQLEAALTSA